MRVLPKAHLIVRFDIPVDSINHTLKLATDTSWEDFRWEVVSALRVLPSEIQLSYKLASQTKDELARALAKSQDLTYLMQECKPFLTGERKCRGNKEFRIQLTSQSTVSGVKEDPKPGPGQRGKKGKKGKEKSTESNDTNDTQEIMGIAKRSAKLQESLKCDKHGSDKSSCWVLTTGKHQRLIPREFSMWATMIVS